MESSNIPTDPQNVLDWEPMKRGVAVSKVLADVHELLDAVAGRFPDWSVEWKDNGYRERNWWAIHSIFRCEVVFNCQGKPPKSTLVSLALLYANQHTWDSLVQIVTNAPGSHPYEWIIKPIIDKYGLIKDNNGQLVPTCGPKDDPERYLTPYDDDVRDAAIIYNRDYDCAKNSFVEACINALLPSMETDSHDAIMRVNRQPPVPMNQLAELSMRGMSEKRKQRAAIFKKIKDKNLGLSYSQVAMEANKLEYKLSDWLERAATSDDVRNDFRDSNWEFENSQNHK